MPAAKKKSPVKVGIWGLGRAGNNMHADEISRFPGEFEVVAGCDPVEERVKILQSKFPQARGYTDGGRFLADPEIELVSIASVRWNRRKRRRAKPPPPPRTPVWRSSLF